MKKIYRYKFKCNYLKNQRYFGAVFFFFDFFKSTLNEHFEKSETHSLSISKIIDCERRGYRSA